MFTQWNFMLNEMSGRKIPYDFTYVWNLESKRNKATKQPSNNTKQSRYKEQIGDCQQGGLGGTGNRCDGLRGTNFHLQYK